MRQWMKTKIAMAVLGLIALAVMTVDIILILIIH